MSRQAAAFKFILNPLFLWVFLLGAGSYFMVSFDEKMMQEARRESSVVNYLKKSFAAMKLRYINKGIDLAGGTYLVLSVELEKAIENRLGSEFRSLDELFRAKQLKSAPKTKELKGMAIELTFDDEEIAKSCQNILQDARNKTLKVTRSGGIVRATLSSDLDRDMRTGAVDQAVNVLTNRLSGSGVEGIVVQRHGDRQVVVQLPGMDDPDRIKAVVTKTAHLEFKIVEASAATRQSLMDRFDGDVPADKMIIPSVHNQDGQDAGEFYLVSAFPDITGEHIIDARVTFDEYNKIVVSFKLDAAGAVEFADLTANNVQRRLGIVIDNAMYSAPTINTPIPGGEGVIQGKYTQKEALDLAIVLRSGSLVAPLKFEQESRVGASLGQDAISKGLLSCAVAMLLLLCFALFYYKVAGLLAIIALMYNMFLTLLALSYFNATLTLPGIAGMVLTIGMAIDASILIYEHIKEELAAGQSYAAAVSHGFAGAMTVILDSNITTFLVGIVLFYFGGPAIKGFAVTLMAGIIATLLSGVWFLRSLFTFALNVLKVRSIKI